MADNPFFGPARPRKTFVLCFDGTGNKFSGTDADSNILKIYRMLDRGAPNELHYYQACQLPQDSTRRTRLVSWNFC